MIAVIFSRGQAANYKHSPKPISSSQYFIQYTVPNARLVLLFSLENRLFVLKSALNAPIHITAFSLVFKVPNSIAILSCKAVLRLVVEEASRPV